MATSTLIDNQTSIDFADTCPYCNGRGAIPKVLLLRGPIMRVVEIVHACILCEGKGILKPESFHDFILRKLAANAHLYNKACQDRTTKKVLNQMFGKFVSPP